MRFGVALGALACTMLVVVAAALAAGELTPQGCIDDNDPPNGPDACSASTDGMNGPWFVTVAPDDRSVLVGARTDNAIVNFNRDPATGALTPAGCIDDDDLGADACPVSVPGLEDIRSIAVSPDGTSVYGAGHLDDAITHFSRDPATGELTPMGCIDDETGPDECARSASGMDGVAYVTVSPDGSSVYAISAEDDAVIRFHRNPDNGRLAPKGCIDDEDTGPDDCGQTFAGLEGARGIVVSPDGGSVYVVSRIDNSLVRFRRNPTNGALRPLECIDDNDNGADECARETDGLDGARTIEQSADGISLYVASIDDHAIVRLARNPATGAIGGATCIDDEDTGADTCPRTSPGLNSVSSIALDPGGESLYAASRFDHALALFDRNATNGNLVPHGCITDNDTVTEECASAVDGLGGARWVDTSADGASVYATGILDDAVLTFARATAD